MILWLLKFLLWFGDLTVDRQVGTWNLVKVICYECLRVKLFYTGFKGWCQIKTVLRGVHSYASTGLSVLSRVFSAPLFASK
jgi:hypothetical protein